jgi:hypothetical protein
MTFTSALPRLRRTAFTLIALPIAAVTLSSCSSSAGSSHPAHPAMPSMGMSSASPSHDMSGMSGMDHGATAGDPGRGLLMTEFGYTLKPMLPSTIGLGGPTMVRFQIVDSAGMPVTKYTVDQTKLLHFYVVRDDLRGYQHLHPELTAGTWTIPVTFTMPGPYRLYTDSEPTGPEGTATHIVLSAPFTVPGVYAAQALPEASTTSRVDGYTVTLASTTVPHGQGTPLTFTVTKNGKPVTDLQTYLDSYAHMTALQSGTLAYEHLHPESTPSSTEALGGPALAFHAEFSAAGTYGLFLQFQTAGVLHLATFNLPVS